MTAKIWLQVLKIFRITAVVAATAAAGAGAWAGYLRLTGNFHEVAPGMFYRSAQPDAVRLSNVIKTYGIRTVINLRGESTDQWYRDERGISVEAGLNYVDFELSSGDDLTDEQLDRLVTLLKDSPRPVLVHCRAGADRSGLASAAYQLVVGNLPREEAAGQLSFRYGHFPWIRSHTAAMDRSFERLAARVKSINHAE